MTREDWYGINQGEKSLFLENHAWSFLADDELHRDQVVYKRLIIPRFRILNIQASTNSKIVWRAIHIGLLWQTTANCSKSYLVSSNLFCSLPANVFSQVQKSFFNACTTKLYVSYSGLLICLVQSWVSWILSQLSIFPFELR